MEWAVPGTFVPLARIIGFWPWPFGRRVLLWHTPLHHLCAIPTPSCSCSYGGTNTVELVLCSVLELLHWNHPSTGFVGTTVPLEPSVWAAKYSFTRGRFKPIVDSYVSHARAVPVPCFVNQKVAWMSVVVH